MWLSEQILRLWQVAILKRGKARESVGKREKAWESARKVRRGQRCRVNHGHTPSNPLRLSLLEKKALTAEGIWNTSVLMKYSTCLANKCLLIYARIVVPSSVKTGITRHFSTLLIPIVGGSSDPVCECKLCAINPLEHVTWGEVLRNKNKT